MMAEKRRKRAALAVLSVLAAGAAVLLLRPPCLIRAVFGVRCPACGTTRMVLAVLAGDFSAAVRENALMLALLPAMLLYGAAETVCYVRGRRPLFYRPWMWVMFGAAACAALAFGVWRNLL